MKRIPLSHLKNNQEGIIVAYNVEDIPLKLIEMGCMEGNLVEFIQKAPFGDPLYLNINGTKLAIRKDIASKIEVELLTTNSHD